MKVSKEKIDIARANRYRTITELAEAYGVSRTRLNMILNQREVTVVSAGRLAKALGVDVTEIIEQ